MTTPSPSPQRADLRPLRAGRRRGALVSGVGAARVLQDQSRLGPAALLHRHPAPQRHGRAAHGPRLHLHAAGRADPSQAHGRLRHPLAARHRPRRHRHAGRGRAPAGRRGQDQGGPRTRGLRGARLEVEGGVGRHDHPPAQEAGRLLRLVASALHDGRGAVPGGARGLRAALRRGTDLSRRPHRELVPALPDGAVRPGSRARGARRGVRLHQVRSAHARHRAARDQAR